MIARGGHNGDSGVRDLTRAHHFSIRVDPIKQGGVLQGLVHLLAGWQSDQELRGLRRLACSTLVVKSDILEIWGSHTSSNGIPNGNLASLGIKLLQCYHNATCNYSHIISPGKISCL